MSDTPRTDEEVEIAKKFPATSHGLWVSAEFARQLERELSARPEVAHIKEAINALPRLVPADLDPEDQANANGEYVSLFGVMHTLDSI